jgi:hypothetical protein
MRLYLKLAGMILLAAAVQWSLQQGGATASELWFAARCGFAHVAHDGQLRERLIIEAQHASYLKIQPPVISNASGGIGH